MATKRRLDMTPSRPDQDPDYEIVTTPTAAKRQRVQEEDAKEQTVRRMQVVIKKQFNMALQEKEKEIELVDERLQKARVQFDKLRACIVARYYGKAGLTSSGDKSKQKLDLSHPAIQRALGHPSKSSTPPSTPLEPEGGINLSRPPSRVDGVVWPESGNSTPIAELLGRSDAFLDSERSSPFSVPQGPRNTGENTFGIGPPLEVLKPPVGQVDSSREGSRFHVKKRIIVGNVSKYIPPGHREDSDPSTHKWMVYVRGPPEEPRIDHFVEKVWFFLHPSYRPNDLLEVKEPPFHLTRRGWGEFPIRVQLHFKDPRNKKVDIIHHLKLDRTYTGLQTLGAETIVDVELDRYLFNESGDPLSRPSTPTVTKVNYKEGLKPDLSRVPTPIRSTIAMGNSTDACRQSITNPSPHLLETIGKTPESTPDRSRPPSRGSTASSPLIKSLPGDGLGSSRGTPLSISLNSSMDSSREDNSADIATSAALSLGRLSSRVKAQSGPALLLNTAKPPRTMPPLGPISTPANKMPILEPMVTQVSPTGIDSLSFSTAKASSGSTINLSSSSNSVAQFMMDGQSVSPPQSGAINVGDIIGGSQGSKLIRIQDGQIVQELSAGALSPTQAKADSRTVVTLNQSVLGTKSSAKISQMAQSSATNASSTALQKISVPNLAGRTQSIIGANANIQNPINVSRVAKQPIVAPTMVRKGPAGVTLVQQTSVAAPPRVPQQPGVMPVVQGSGGGTQYYVTAKSTDKNLQGKVILIPQQVFSQSNQQGKGGRGAAQSQAKQGSGSFLSPSNVLILPQGSIVPPLPPGSIVQIQPVPTPTRPSAQSSSASQQMTRIALTQKSGASTIISPKPATQRVGSGGGVIQIQRSAGQTLAKLVPAAAGVASQQSMPSSSVSLIPEMKGQLARTPQGGVVLVQRTPSASKSNAVQTITGIQNVISNQTVPVAQKISLNQISGSSAGTSQQKVSLPIKGGASVLMSQASKASTSRTIVLQSQAPTPSTNSTKTIQVRTAQPTVKTITKFVPPLDEVKGQSSKKVSPNHVPNSSESMNSVLPKVTETKDALRTTMKSDVDVKTIKEKEPDLSLKDIEIDVDVDVIVDVETTDNSSSVEGEKATKSTSTIPIAQEGTVQIEESMQISISDTASDGANGDASKPSPTPSSDENVKASEDRNGKETSLISVNKCEVKIKKEPEEEPMEVETILNQNANNLNGHCVIPAATVHSSKTTSESASLRVNTPKSNVSAISDIVHKESLMAPTSSTNLQNKCVIKVVNAKLNNPACQVSTAGKLGDSRLRVIRIKQEHGAEPILATLATAPVVSLDANKATISVDTRLGAEVEDKEGWESRELRNWMRVLGSHVAEETNLYGVTDMEQLMKYVAEEAPMIDSTRVQNELPFCATSLDHYHSWTLPKRRSMEWQRAVFMRDKVGRLKSLVPRLRDAPNWSKKKIVVWCRRHGFTPSEPGLNQNKEVACSLCGKMGCGGKSHSKSGRRLGCLNERLSKSGVLKHPTFSTPEDLGRQIQDSQSSMKTRLDPDDDMEIDVITPGDPFKRLRIKTEGDDKQELKCFMPPSEGATFIRDTAEKIGVHFRPVQVGEDTYSPVNQEMIYAAARQFLTDLVRGSLAKGFGDREDHSLPDEILPLHVHQAIASMRSCDFLTNKYLGVVSTTTDEPKDAE